MSAVSAVFLLMLISHPGNTLSMTKIRDFPSEAACEAAAKTISDAIGDTGPVEIGCVPLKGITDLQHQIR